MSESIVDAAALAATPSPQAIAEQCQAVLSHHARSFRWAQAFLPHQTANDAAVLYAFCRAADDAVDEAASALEGKTQLAWLRAQFNAATPSSPMVALLHRVCEDHGLERAAIDDLLDGVEQDASEVRVADRGELLRYCYRVAGTVGHLMNGLLGVRDPRALPYAVDLGIAMQLTNISRDVYEDRFRERLYVPADAIRAAGDDPVQYLEGTTEPRSLRPVVKSLLDLAEHYYRSAERGMPFIPWRARFAILIAARLYRGIGRRIAQSDYAVWGTRHYVSGFGKLLLVGGAAISFVATLWQKKRGGHDTALHVALTGLKSWPPKAVDANPTDAETAGRALGA